MIIIAASITLSLTTNLFDYLCEACANGKFGIAFGFPYSNVINKYLLTSRPQWISIHSAANLEVRKSTWILIVETRFRIGGGLGKLCLSVGDLESEFCAKIYYTFMKILIHIIGCLMDFFTERGSLIESAIAIWFGADDS